MNDTCLNLTRKWRAKVFDHIIGQNLTVRILKNSLYGNKFFPVYLLWGQRGSGKTSTARVFAAAINCEQLDSFRKNPKQTSIPCLKCLSCRAMMSGRHPDFIEMDAASHTGVDNIRQIIDAASLMPLLGRKKIYLIDEAHMLSKAAFNAFLKILEEPPASVLFLLATTDPEKIIDTVKSRCFQLFFKPVSLEPMLNHLEHICKEEDISYEPEALSLIIKETDGSVRDAINLLEQVRFSAGSVSKSGVIRVLGHIDDGHLIDLLEIALNQGTNKLISFLEKVNIRQFSAEQLWIHLINLVRTVIWLKHGIESQQYHEQIIRLRAIIQQISIGSLTTLLEHFYSQESIFMKTTDKHLFLEILLLQICQRNNPPTNFNMGPATPLSPPQPQTDEYINEDEYDDENSDEIDEEEEGEEEIDDLRSDSKRTLLWENFLGQLKQLDDPLLNSIFKQGLFSEFNEKTSTVNVYFSKEFVFFTEWLDNTRNLWHPLLQKVFGESVIFNPIFTLKGPEINGQCQQKLNNGVVSAITTNNACISSFSPSKNGEKYFSDKLQGQSVKKNAVNMKKRVDVSDAQQWQKSNLLLRYFPGVVSEY